MNGVANWDRTDDVKKVTHPISSNISLESEFGKARNLRSRCRWNFEARNDFWIFEPLNSLSHRERARVRGKPIHMDAKVPMLRDRARQLRRNQTAVEGKLWFRLRARRLSRAKFRRQFPIGTFIADFCCYERRLVIELDGGHHAEHMEADQSRTVCFPRLPSPTLLEQ